MLMAITPPSVSTFNQHQYFRSRSDQRGCPLLSFPASSRSLFPAKAFALVLIFASVERGIMDRLCLFLVKSHEAGHFLVGYLLGVLPKGYRVPSMEVLTQDKFAEGRVDFLGFEFLKEVDTEKISKYTFTKEKLCDGTVNRLLSVILGGLVSEHMVFGCSEGLHADVEKLDRVLKWLEFTEDEAESLVKWAARTTVLILDHHREARSRLAEAMALGRSVGFCIDTIENALNDGQI